VECNCAVRLEAVDQMLYSQTKPKEVEMEKRWTKQLSIAHKKAIFPLLMVTIMTLAQIIPKDKALGKSSHESKQEWKILHIMSYHSPWKWTDDQFNGFKAALRGMDIEYRVFQMDTKRKSTEEWKQRVGREARDLIDTWKSDLVYTNDDSVRLPCQVMSRDLLQEELQETFCSREKALRPTP
jgi:hypothetical protein